jgi:DNA-binding transcriptional LysR family regulator
MHAAKVGARRCDEKRVGVRTLLTQVQQSAVRWHPGYPGHVSEVLETEIFVAVARSGSFAAAATKLDISASYASKLVTRLEQRLGARLFHRSTRALTLTAIGERYYEDCARAFELIENATSMVLAKQSVPHGRLRVSVPTGLGHEWISCVIARYVMANPQVQLDAVYIDRFVDLVAEGFDVAVRVGMLRDSSLVARRLASTRVSLVANSGRALTDAAVFGLGVAFVPDFHCARRLAAGELVRVLPQWSGELPIHAVYPSAQLVPVKVRAFVEHLIDELRTPGWTELVAD